MAKRHHAPDVIEEFESAAEKLAHWIGTHAWQVGGSLVVMLGLAAGWGGYESWSRSRAEAASDALAQTRAGYLLALGAQPGALAEPELANPEAARAIREQYVEKFQAVAGEHQGTVAGALALLETANLLDKLGRTEQVAAVWRQALEGAAGNPGLEGVLQQRIAESHERRGAWADAAAAHESAGRLSGYPLRHWALVDAARCYAAAGQTDRALAIYEEVEGEAPELGLPAHIRSQLRELRALQAS